MATSQMAAMLDELMGRNRNIGLDEKPVELHWSDPDVCKYFVVTFCPHELFTNTKADLGPCGKIHDEDLRAKFAEDRPDNARKMQFQEDFLRFCGRILSDLQVRIKKAKERLHLTQTENALPPSASDKHRDVEDQLELLSSRIAALVDEAEAAGTQGNVEQAQGLLILSDQLREERDELRRSVMPFLGKEEYTTQQKAMEVCDICGAFLIVGDAQQRIDDHLMGKQHIGYARLRAAVDNINEERRKLREDRDKEVDDRRRPREPDGRGSRDLEDSRDSRGSRDKDRDRDRRDRERRRSRSRDRDRRRSRSRDRGRRRGHSRDRSSRERRRSRSRDRKGPPESARARNSSRRSRSRDCDQRKRSRSGEDETRKSHRENGSPREASSAAAAAVQNQENVD